MKISRRRVSASIAIAALALPLALAGQVYADESAEDDIASIEISPEPTTEAPETTLPQDVLPDEESSEEDIQLLVVPPIPAAPSAEEYWTSDRMENAEPMDVIEADEAELGEVQLISGSPGKSSVPRVYGELPAMNPFVAAAYQHNPVSHIGKVFFSKNGKNYVCSGSSIASAHGNLVATAGHCIYSDGKFVTNFTFVPAYNNGQAPHGHWQAAMYTTTAQWANSTSHGHDVGFVTVHNSNGRTLHQTVGSRPAGFNQPRNQHSSVYGYPAGSPFNGQYVIACHGNRVQKGNEVNILGMHQCPLNGGASGGPWYTGGDSYGSQVSVNSFIIGDGGIYGPYFGDIIEGVYRHAAGYNNNGGGGDNGGGGGNGASPHINDNLWYRIKNANSNKCIDASEWGSHAGTVLQQWDCNPAFQWNQDWQLTHVSDGWYTIKHRHGANRIWDVDGGTGAVDNGKRVLLWDRIGNNGNHNQQWKPERNSDGTFTLKARHSNKCLDISSSSHNNGARVQQWNCNGSAAQKFHLNQAPNA